MWLIRFNCKKSFKIIYLMIIIKVVIIIIIKIVIIIIIKIIISII